MVVTSEGESGALLDTMIQSGVITPVTEDGGRVTEEFEERSERFDADLRAKSGAERRSAVETRVTDASHAAEVIQLGEHDPSIVSEYLALCELNDEGTIAHADRLAMLSVLDAFRSDAPPVDGAPAAFLPISGGRLPLVGTVYEKSIVYVWLDDCDPCETVRDDLDEIFGDAPDDLALFAVYGPDHNELLFDEYDVHGGPTLLFFHRDRVDARLHGAQYQDVLRTEIEKHRRL